VEDVEEIERADVNRGGLDAGAVEGRGHTAGGTQTTRGPFALLGTRFGAEARFHGRSEVLFPGSVAGGILPARMG
jgi:hypothetical protein